MKYIFFAFAFCCSTLAIAQVSGKVSYEEKFNLHKNIPADRPEMKEMMPEYNSSMFELIFSGTTSIYQPLKDAETTDANTNNNSGNQMMMMRFGRENRIVYKDITVDTMIESRDFMQKQFLIVGAPTARKWKIGTKQKVILGHQCMEADYRQDSTMSMVVWFAPDISVSNGPSDYQGLPGLILGVDVNDGLRTVTATNINLDPVEPAAIIAPTKGKQVTREEFDKIRKEKMQEMHMNNQNGPGGGPGTMIYIQHN